MSILRSLGKTALDIAKSRISDCVKKAQLGLEAVTLTKDNMYSLHAGDFVRMDSGKQFYMVVKPKTEVDEGVLAVLRTSSAEWYYRLEYDPYLGELARDWSEDPKQCRDEAGADSKANGLINTDLILKHKCALETEGLERNSYLGCPAPIHYFPALDFVKGLGGNCYLPAIQELHDIFHDEIILSRLLELLSLCGYELDEEINIWSSTENTNPPCGGAEAFSLLSSTRSPAIVQSRLKSKSAYVIPFMKF